MQYFFNQTDKMFKHHKCSILSELIITGAQKRDYDYLARFHYRSGNLGPYVKMYKIINKSSDFMSINEPVGLIVYTMPVPSIKLRNIATKGMFTGLESRHKTMQSVNANFRCISRVIIDPRFRGLGLARLLVAETMKLMPTPYVEALAVMGRVNPFFEKAGMKKYTAESLPRVTNMTKAFENIGISKSDLIEPAIVQKKMESLSPAAKRLLNLEICKFLVAYGKRKNMPPGPERIRFVIRKLGPRPNYYLWRNPENDLNI